MSNKNWGKFTSGGGLNFEIATTGWNSVRIDPYLVWACATEFTHFVRTEEKNKKDWVPIVIELDRNSDLGTASNFSKACLDSDFQFIQIPNIYYIETKPYKDITFLTALVKLDEFLAALDNKDPILSTISRFQMGLSVKTELETYRREEKRSERGNPKYNIGDNDQTEFLESTSSQTKKRPIVGSIPIVGIIDDGVGFLNTNFNDSNGRTRIRYFWNQNGDESTPQSIAPIPKHNEPEHYSVENLGYGYELIHTDIDGIRQRFTEKNLANAENSSYGSLSYSSVARHASHGTHMLDLAAGYRNDSNKHIWDETALIAVQVHNSSDITPDTSGRWMGVRMLDGIRYILERATRLPASINSSWQYNIGYWESDKTTVLERPVLINISQGNIAGPHNGTSILEKAIDELIETHESTDFPLSVFLSSGNHKQSRCHASVNVMPSERKVLSWRVYPDDRTPNFMELWLPEPKANRKFDENHLEIRVCAPGEAFDAARPIKLGECRLLRNNTDIPECVVVGLSKNNNATGDRGMFLCAISPTLKTIPNAATPGVWNIYLCNRSDSIACEINAWIERDDATINTVIAGTQSHFEDSMFNHLDEFGYPLQHDKPSYGVIRVEGTISGIATGAHTEIVEAKSSDYSGTGTKEPKLASVPRQFNVRKPNISVLVDDSKEIPGKLAAGTLIGSQIGKLASGTLNNRLARR